MGKKKNNNKKKTGGGGPPMAVGGLTITDTRTNKKPKVAEATKSNVPNENRADNRKVKETVEVKQEVVPELVEESKLPENDTRTEPDCWEDVEVEELPCNFPSNDAGGDSNEKTGGNGKQNEVSCEGNDKDEGIKDQNEEMIYQSDPSSNSVATEKTGSVTNKDDSCSFMSKDQCKNPEFTNKGAVHKEFHQDSHKLKQNQGKVDNNQDQNRGRGKGSDYQGNQKVSEKHLDQSRSGGSRDNFHQPRDSYHEKDSGKYKQTRGWENTSRQPQNNRREPENLEQNRSEGRHDSSHWDRGNSSQGNSERNQEQNKSREIGNGSRQSQDNYQSNRRDSGRNQEQNRSRDKGNNYDQPQIDSYRDKNASGSFYRDKSPRSRENYNQNRNRRFNNREDDSYQSHKSNTDWGSPNRNNESKDKEYNEFWTFFDSFGKQNYVKVQEIEGDLFAMSKEEYSLAHCVAEDMAMGSGIAVQFSREFKQRGELLQQRQKQGGLAVLENGPRYVYYLVTKRLSTGKPTYHTLWSSLQKMQKHVQEHSVAKLALPRIGCGLDRLEWSKVKLMLEYTFRNTNVEVTVCNFQQAEDGPSPSQPKISRCPVKNITYPLVQIEPYTAVVYFGSEDSFVTEETQSLDTKFKILQDYKTANKKVGEVIQSSRLRNTYILYGFIVNKSQNDPFNYANFQKCIDSFKKMNTKDNRSEYVGIQAFLDDEDDLIMNKIVNILRYSLYNVEIYVSWPGKMAPFMPQERRDYEYHY